MFWPLIAFSLLMYWRGHQSEGGGFVGGLLAAAAFAVVAFAEGAGEMRRRLVLSPWMWLALGLAFAYGAGALPWMTGTEFLTGLWGPAPIIGKVGSAMLFDLGVYFVVVGMISLIITEVMASGEEL